MPNPKKYKSPTSPPDKIGRRGNKRTPSSGVKPVAFDENKYDNPAMDLMLIFGNNTDLTLSFDVASIRAKSFISGRDMDPLHDTVRQAILDSICKSLSRIFTVDNEVREALERLVAASYHKSHVNDRCFSFTHSYAHDGARSVAPRDTRDSTGVTVMTAPGS